MAGETVEGRDHECVFNHHGIKLRCKSKPLDGIKITSRCIRYEENADDFGISDSENLCSKVYVFRIENSDAAFKVKVTMPVHKEPDESEEIVIKTNSNKEVSVSKTKQDTQNGWFSTFKLTLKGEVSVVALCRPKFASSMNEIAGVLPEVDQEHRNTTDNESPTNVTQSSVSSSVSSITNEEYDVIFHVMSKYSKRASSEHEVIVDCSEVPKALISRGFWEKKGFQMILQSVPCKTVAKQTFQVSLHKSDSGKDKNKTGRSTLQFHPLRPNFVKLKIQCKENKVSETLSRLEIQKVSLDASNQEVLENSPLTLLMLSKDVGKTGDKNKQEERGKDKHGNTEGKLVRDKNKDEEGVNGSYSREGTHRKDQRGKEEKLPRKEYQTVDKDQLKKDLIQREFLNDDLLSSLQAKFEDSWVDILVLLEIPFTTMEKELYDSDKLNDTRLKLLQQWRDGNRHRADKGIPQLLSAFLKCGKIECGQFLRLALKDWRHQAFAPDDPLYLWLERAYADPDVFIPTSYPRPMSDQYLVLLCSRLTPSLDLATSLKISKEEYKWIVDATINIGTTMTLMKIFTLYRDKEKNLEGALIGLLDALKMLEHEDQWSRGISCASGWLTRHPENSDELRITVKRILERNHQMYRREQTFERKWSQRPSSYEGLHFSRQRSVQPSRPFTPTTSRIQVHQDFFD